MNEGDINKKERMTIYLEIFLLVMITLTSIFIEISNNRMDDYNFDIISQENNVNHEFEIGIRYLLETMQITQQKSLNIILPKEDLNETKKKNYTDEEIKNINIAFDNGTINQEEYLIKSFEWRSKKLEETTHNYNLKKGYLIRLFDNQPKCFGFKCNTTISILRVIQIIAILIAFIVYYILLKNIKNRDT